MSLLIDVISDVVCPWCFIGKRRLEAALALYRAERPEAAAPQVRWWPYELNPDLPPEGMDRQAYVARKFGAARGADAYARVSAIGKEVGIEFRFERIARQPNTLAAHSLIALAGELGRQDALQEALFTAYFLNGADLTQAGNLAAIACDAGLPEAAVLARLDDADARAAVRAQEDEARRLGVSGVPFFIFNQALAVSGAHEAPTLLQAMLQAEEQAAAATAG